MKRILIGSGVVVGVLALAVAGLFWALNDPNRFKPQLESLVKQSTGLEVALKGDLSWQLWPPVVLEAETIHFEDDQTRYEVGGVGVRAKVLPLIFGNGNLEVEQLRVNDLVMTDKRSGERTFVDALRLDDFVPGQPSPLHVEARLEDEDDSAVAVVVDGMLSYYLDEDRLTLDPMSFTYDDIQGDCKVAASQLSREPSIAHTETDDDLLPLDVLRSIDWQAQCTVPRFVTDEVTLRDIAIDSQNANAQATNQVSIPEAFGGQIAVDVAIDTRKATPQWRIKSNATKLQSQQLMDLLAPRLNWVAPLLMGGEYRMQGNTPDALVESMNGSMSFDSNGGEINIGAIKEAVVGMATLAGKAEKVAAWQDRLNYTKLAGKWQTNGTQQDIEFVIDNIKLVGNGMLNALTGDMDLRSSIVIERHPSLDVLPVSDDFYGVPIPLRCTGTLDGPDCGMDRDAAKQTLSAIASAKAGDKAKAKLDEAIDEKVPEEYRETAREALKSLGGLLGGKDKKAPE